MSPGYMVAVVECWSCGVRFGCNPELVPSIIVDGEREPLCADCVERANVLRTEQEEPRIIPLPGAYEPEEIG